MRPQQRSRTLRVGALVVGFGVVFVGLVLFVVGASFDQERVEYQILFEENIKGMVVGSRVNYQGVPTGVVSDIRFERGATHVTLSLDPSKAMVYDVTRARLDRLLVTGQVTIELEGWSDSARLLPGGARIEPVRDPMASLTRTLPEVIDQAAQVLTTADRALGRLDALLSGDNAERIERTLANIEKASEELPIAALDTLGEMHNAVTGARGVMDSLDLAAARLGDLAASDGALAELLAEGRAAVAKLSSLQARVHQVADDAQGLLTAVRLPVLTTLERVRESFREMQGVAQMLRMAPEVLLYGRERPAGQPAGWPAAPGR